MTRNLKRILLLAGYLTVGGNTFATNDPNCLVFSNPAYIEGSAVAELNIPNGSLLLTGSNGFFGKTLRAAFSVNNIDNPLGVNHAGLIFNENPSRVFNMVLSKTYNKRGNFSEQNSISEKSAKNILAMLKRNYNSLISTTTDPGELRTMTFEANNTVEINDFNERIKKYDGNIFVRPLSTSIPRDITFPFIEKYIDRDYESIETFGEILNSFKSENKIEADNKVFCSELATLFYQKAGVLKKDILPNNVLPEHYYGEGSNINLNYTNESVYKFDSVVPVKIKYTFTEDQLNGNTCWDKFVKWVLK